jgi:hypothetical protein
MEAALWQVPSWLFRMTLALGIALLFLNKKRGRAVHIVAVAIECGQQIVWILVNHAGSSTQPLF